MTGGPKLVQIDLATNEVVNAFPFDEQIAPQGAYLNDVRIDNERGYAYITDSGKGEIVVVNLDTGEAHRLLTEHPSTHAENIIPHILGKPLVTPDGNAPQLHADGIALSPDGDWLYYHALTGYHLYRVPTEALRHGHEQPEALAAAVEDLGRTVVCDGMVMDGKGNLYLTNLERGTVVRRTPTDQWVTVAPIAGPPMLWPDTLAIGPDGGLFVTASQIHLMARFNNGKAQHTVPYRVYRFPLDLAPQGEQ